MRAAQYGLRVAVIEKERPGGVCLNWGCIPTKAMLRSAEVLELVQHSGDYGVLVDGSNVRLDYPAVLKRKDAVVKQLTDGVGQLLKANGATLIDGHARFTSPTALEVVGVGSSPLGQGGPLYNAPA
ncbi:MAG TPA: FAD-dependent oxidoreductase, partial [Chloroflexota bacterium]|nr:FAD-dependent oxidoreductase [Chloroflexota bacterium]